MPLIERYVMRRAFHAFLLTAGGLVATFWLIQVLRDLDVVTAKGQTIWIFLVVTVLALPAIIQVVAPIAYVIAVVVTLNGLTSDSELPVIAGAGASRKAVHRPILVLGALIMVAVAFSHHIAAPASLAALRSLMSKVRVEVISTLVQSGGFRELEDKLMMHVREKAPDGTFKSIFISDQRDPNMLLQYSAAEGVLLERSGHSFLILKNGDLIRENREKNENSIIAFDAYALDLSQIGTPGVGTPKARERSTFYFFNPDPDDRYFRRYKRLADAEFHDRMTAPLFTPAFALICLGLLGRPRTNRHDRTFAILGAVLVCFLLRTAGFTALAAAGTRPEMTPFMYAVPILGIAFGVLAISSEGSPSAFWSLGGTRPTRIWRSAVSGSPSAEFGLAGPDPR